MISGFLCSVFKAIDLGHRKELSYSPQATDGQKGPERETKSNHTGTPESNRTQGVSQGPDNTTEKDALENQKQQQQLLLFFLSLSFLKPLSKLSAFEAGKLYKPFSNTPNTPHQKHQIK